MSDMFGFLTTRLILSFIGVDECSSVGLNQCAHQCVDRLSGFECRCRPGYKLMGDKKSCRGKDFPL